MQQKTCNTTITIALTGDPEEISTLTAQLTYPDCTRVDLFTIDDESGAYRLTFWNTNMLRYNLQLHDQKIQEANIIVYINAHYTDTYLCENVKTKDNLWFTLNFNSVKEIPTNFLESLVALKAQWETCKTFPQKWRLIKSGATTSNNKLLNPQCIFNTLPEEITDKILMECHRVNTNNYSLGNPNQFFHAPAKKPSETDPKKEKREVCVIQ